jgi:L-alanine-DL-glutamate epimerase-like enolase superfamily enzyme
MHRSHTRVIEREREERRGQTWDNTTVTLVRILDSRFGLVGRGTVVSTAKLAEVQKEEEEEEVVVKLAWQVVTRKPEWEWIQEAVERNAILKN